MMTALIKAVHAQDTFSNSNLRCGRTRSLTILFAKAAVGAIIFCLADSPEGKTTAKAEKRSRGAYKTAKKTRHRQI